MYIFLIIRLFFAVLISFLLTSFIVPLCISMAHRLQILDVPDGKIKTHTKTTPYLGGLAIYIGFISSLALTLPFYNNLLPFVLGATLLLFVGLVDDLIRMRHYQKFFWQFLVTICFLKGGLHLKENFFLKGYWTIPISLVWILAVINAYNLVDVMDGLATSLALWATASFMILAILSSQAHIGILLGALFGALLAFFLYNRPNASIYLGDGGSLFVGGQLATIPFLFHWGTYNMFGLIIPIIILAIPLLEISALIIIRTYKKIPFYCASPDHFSIYLIKAGWSKWHVLSYTWILSLALMTVATLFLLNKVSVPVLLWLALIFITVWIAVLIMSVKNRKTSLT